MNNFFELYDTELLSVGGWLGDPKFTVEELYQAFKVRVVSDLETAFRAELSERLNPSNSRDV